ncbi:hypothetical protein K2173_004432 [Erythroxylum novogranatense]|uniref:Endonuclease/exonuclease/phosphatase domain-containing protein n=1 Tax=Erythroxylum novogranatense TaxID=1862640 RepID=A0AAV8T5K9_9ROSI|nr:hypothetical protein K2173_004432 [Erythroxylum novogranatense]
MKIRVRMDIRQPLKRKKKLIDFDGHPFYVTFRYQQIQVYCYFCGKLSHTDSFCDLLLHHKKGDPQPLWSENLRATPHRITLPFSSWLRPDLAGTSLLSGPSIIGNNLNVPLPSQTFLNSFLGAHKYGDQMGLMQSSMDMDQMGGTQLLSNGPSEDDPIDNHDEEKKRARVRSDGTQWRLTGFYGFPERTRRRASWNLLRALAARSQLPWLCCGDFNDITALYEKLGGPPRPSHLMSGFREALSDAHLSDILQVGSSFTYTYREGSAACVKEKLDRACSTVEWSSLFRDAICSVLVAPVSDHSPLLIDIASTSSEGVHRRFLFDNSWLSEPDLGETVDREWVAGATLSFSHRTSLVVDHIQLWGK